MSSLLASLPAQFQVDDGTVKKRAACDECRTKKLKCTGEQPSCARCVRESIPCVYSAQKRMGRPKKRQRIDDGEVENDRRRGPSTDGITDSALWNTDGNGFDASFWDPSFNANNLSSWLNSGGRSDWSSTFPADTALPPLTPDSSSNSPPLLNLPPELQNIHHQHTTPPIDPSFAQDNLGLPPSLLPSCACLSSLYLTLNTLQSMEPSFAFPMALHPLREAMTAAHEATICEHCPSRFISAIQNTQLLGTLLISIAERFAKTLSSITKEAERAEAANETKKFRLADLNTSTAHLHTGGLGCAAAFNIDLNASEWRSMSKKVIKAEVYGPADGNTCCPYFLSLCERMENRHDHYAHRRIPDDFPKDPKTGLVLGGHNMPKEDHICLKLVAYARRLVEGYDWT